MPFLFGHIFAKCFCIWRQFRVVKFIHPTIIKDAATSQAITRQRYGEIRSLQIAFDADGSFATLPDEPEQMYQSRLTIPTQGQAPQKYQTVPVTAVNNPLDIDLRQGIKPTRLAPDLKNAHPNSQIVPSTTPARLGQDGLIIP